MGIPILIIGKSGSGKSSSLRNFNEDEIGLINVSMKPLPFKRRFKAVIETDSYEDIKTTLGKTQLQTIIIDDAGYLIVNMFMSGHSSAGTGNAVFSFYNKVADSFWSLIEFIKRLPSEKIVYVIMHEDKTDMGDIKPKTIGKLLDEKVCIEGMFTICLRSCKDQNGFFFQTQSDGFSPAKTPFGMFADTLIVNDLKMVNETIKSFYGIGENDNG